MRLHVEKLIESSRCGFVFYSWWGQNWFGWGKFKIQIMRESWISWKFPINSNKFKLVQSVMQLLINKSSQHQQSQKQIFKLISSKFIISSINLMKAPQWCVKTLLWQLKRPIASQNIDNLQTETSKRKLTQSKSIEQFSFN